MLGDAIASKKGHLQSIAKRYSISCCQLKSISSECNEIFLQVFIRFIHLNSFQLLTGLKIREAIPQHCSRSRLEVQELRQKFSSRRMRLKVKILVLVSMHETESKNSRSRLEARD